uniref:Uncharacterized protein n=1 Tax=Candidatus Kentrum sp. LPFa TaxID=2126335 RepID=A0A450XNK3_9GAMM|nr:MAG: hypothetical protein BECKLPF1236C_GA0070990_101234 [Candidatus Kentron sp. LPFa]
MYYPNPTKPEPKIFVHYSPVIPLISGNPVTNISLVFLDRFVKNFPDNGINSRGKAIHAKLRCLEYASASCQARKGG